MLSYLHTSPFLHLSDRAKVQSDVEDLMVLFKNHIKKFRPSLNIDKVATGEVWYGPDALALNLCDELCTSDELLMRMRDDGSDIYSVQYKEPKEPPFANFSDSFANLSQTISLMFQMLSSSMHQQIETGLLLEELKQRPIQLSMKKDDNM